MLPQVLCSALPLVRMHAFEVREHNVTVEIMMMIVAGMRHDSVGYAILASPEKARPQRGHICSKGT